MELLQLIHKTQTVKVIKKMTDNQHGIARKSTVSTERRASSSSRESWDNITVPYTDVVLREPLLSDDIMQY